jgi:hypothetical protein
MRRGSPIRWQCSPELQKLSQGYLPLVDRIYAGEKIRIPQRHTAIAVTTVYREWNEARKAFSAGLPVEAPVAPYSGSLGQRGGVASSLQTLSGLCRGFALAGEADLSASPEEMEAWLKDIDQALRTLRRFKTKVKGTQK